MYGDRFKDEQPERETDRLYRRLHLVQPSELSMDSLLDKLEILRTEILRELERNLVDFTVQVKVLTPATVCLCS